MFYYTHCWLWFLGASHYGIGDLEALAGDTHKFESRYLDNLIAPYTGDGIKIYKERSPINYIEKLDCPIALFQGDEDKVNLRINNGCMIDTSTMEGL